MAAMKQIEFFKLNFILPLLSFIGALYGFFYSVKYLEENKCDMTYMFEYPEYLKIPLSYDASVKFPRYNLYIYAEGKYVDHLSAQRYEGIPVLFIPGNAGSHRQVRSLASVALRMSQSRQTKFHFNFFSIDFNEEISALYGGILDEQTEFVWECIERIRSLYSVEKKLILIGHSMGGVISKAVFSLPLFDPSYIDLILTLASPHRKPVISMDSYIVALYEKISLAWKYRLKTELRNIPVISIGGGERDILVRSDLILNNFTPASDLDFHVLTSSIPGVWLSTDHLAIVWCKQLVLSICRCLFDIISLRENKLQIPQEPHQLESIFKFYFVSKSSGGNWLSSWHSPIHSFSRSSLWLEKKEKTWRFSQSKVLSSVYIMIPLYYTDHILIVSSGLTKGDWIFGCTEVSEASSKSCIEGENLSVHGEIIPSRKSGTERRKVNFKIEDLREKGYSSLLIYIAPVNSPVEILSEIYSENERTKYFPLPFLELFSLSPHRIFSISLVERVVYYNVTIPRNPGMYLAVEFLLETRLCRAGSVAGQGLIKFQNSWSNDVSYYHIRTSLGGVTRIPVVTHSLPHNHANPVVSLEFIFDPECSFVLLARLPFYLIASQFVKLYGTYVLGYSIAYLMVLVADQMDSVGSRGMPSTVYEMIGKVSSFFFLVILPSFSYHLIWLSRCSLSFLPKPDEISESYDFFYSLGLRSLLYFISCGTILCTYICIECSLKAIYLCVICWKRRSVLETTQMPLEKVLRNPVRISKSVLVWSSFTATVCLGVSSSLASVIAAVYAFFKLAFMYTRSKMEEDRRGSSAATRHWQFHGLLLLIWFFVLLLTFPGCLMWSRNLKFSLKPIRDIYVPPCILMVVSAGVLWQLPSPITHRYRYKTASAVIKTMALLTTLYGISSVYRLLYFLTAVFSLVCFQQTCGYFKEFRYSKND